MPRRSLAFSYTPLDLPSPGFRRAFAGPSLAGRLLRVIFGCYFAVAILVTAGQILTEYRNAHFRLEHEIEAMQRTFGRGLADAVWSFNTGVLHGILNGISEMPVVVGVEVQDEHGRVLDRVDSVSGGQRHPAVLDQPFERAFPLVYVDENQQKHALGRWVVRSNDGIALDQVKDTLIVILINSILKTTALWAIFWLVIQRMVARPLSQITSFLLQLDASMLGAKPLRLGPRENDDLHVLVETFNGLAAKLRRAFDDNDRLMRDLQEANATLQARVEERTRDLEQLARTDQLTGLGNRRHLDEVLGELTRSRSGSRFSVIVGDIDHFKSVNDQHGHAVGDAVIICFADVLREMVRPCDTPGRWGGEEFMIICPGTGLRAAGDVAEAMRVRLARQAHPDVGIRTCSFGVAEHGEGEDLEALLARADAALYAAKRNGRDQVCVSLGAETLPERIAA